MHKRRLLLCCLLLAGLAAVAAPPAPSIRVALMDFSTDDNSWRSAQAAANFTSLAQAQLANEPGVEWIERAQLDLARQELKLSEMELLGSASPIRRGKWVKADWMITGQFSLDDRSHRILSLEITHLKHADVLASKTISLPGQPGAPVQPVPAQVEFAAGALRQLLAEARRRQQATANQAVIAPLFVVDVTSFGLRAGAESLEREFYGALDRAVATNPQVRIIRFPKAYRAMEEAEMVLDGLVEADPQAWQHVADLYVWGTYAVTNANAGTNFQRRMEFTLHLWDGASRPHMFREKAPMKWREGLPPDAARAMLERMVTRVLTCARRQEPGIRSDASRREIAESIARSYRQLAAASHGQLGLHDEAGLVQAVHMLETACFFDPENADLHVMRNSCRYGWWMDFRFKLKNPFWSYWRRSQAWGHYVDRFGLEPTATPLPFPYEMRGLGGVYVSSLEEVLRMFPQRYEPDDEEQQQRGVHTALREAQAHGFPKDMPRDSVLKWKAEVEAELTERKRKVSDYTQATATNAPPKAASNSVAALPPPPASSPRKTSPPPGASPPPVPHGYPYGQRAPAPDWLKQINPLFKLFNLSPPPILPAELKPVAQHFPFPAQFEVRGVLQMALYQGRLLVLAMDERSMPTSEAKPDLSAELLNQRGRLWSLDPRGKDLALMEPSVFPATIHSFLLEHDRLWLAGDGIGCLDLKTQSLRQFGLREGLTARSVHSIALAGGRLFAAGDLFQLYQLPSGGSQWQELRLPSAKLSTGTGRPCLVAGNDRWLGYLAGSALLYDIAASTWTNVQQRPMVDCLQADNSGFWYGGHDGLQRYDLDQQSLAAWQCPANIRGLDAFALGSYQRSGGPGPTEEAVTNASESIQRFLKKLQKERVGIHEKRGKPVDPLRLDWRMPGGVAALGEDGDFLWVATTGSHLLLIHKPSVSLVGWCRLDGSARSLCPSDRHLWIGTAYGQQLLTRIEKRSLLSVPRSQWLPLAVTPSDRSRLVKGMSVRDQAMYAFYSGDDARVAEVLRNVSPEKASLEEMFLLAFAHDAYGLDQPDRARAWFGRIAARYPDSPWAAAAEEFLAESEQAHTVNQRQTRLLAQYDRNHDGVLDEVERRAMEKDPAYQREERAVQDDQLDVQLQSILKKYDRNGDERLDWEELEHMRRDVRIFSEAPPQMLEGRKIVLAPLVTKDFPSVERILKKHDTRKDGALGAAGLKALAKDIQNSK